MTEQTSFAEMARTRRAFAVEKRSLARDVTDTDMADPEQAPAPIPRASSNTAISPFTGQVCRKLREPQADLRRIFREDDPLTGFTSSQAQQGATSAAAAGIARAELSAPRPIHTPPRNRDFASALLEQVRQ
ncbi:hypothetical protein Q9295_15970 [Xinfangfangia sp. CPCC 101601]|uniref:Uncharacterized protein n=1 Tax=Pseudogemmobacter lacusdianii TaxID=3069608 RepID=A0ABU0W1H5_9RHOB|nr:hypothetical protein [Xinfangfangia sp. CPCC 101601]MDQ2067872.1 hypothetical protein [Xinfangfangia sp. CPCC 101601]